MWSASSGSPLYMFLIDSHCSKDHLGNQCEALDHYILFEYIGLQVVEVPDYDAKLQYIHFEGDFEA